MSDLRCVIIDDEYLAIKVLEGFCARIPGLGIAATFKDPRQALHFLEKESVDLVLLDIQMPHISGVELSAILSNRKMESRNGTGRPLLVFTTARHEFAVQAFDLEALDYLVKPIAFDRFEKTIRKAREQRRLLTAEIPDTQVHNAAAPVTAAPVTAAPGISATSAEASDASSRNTSDPQVPASDVSASNTPAPPDAAEDQHPETLLIRSDHRTMRLPLTDIILIEGWNEYVKVHISGKTIVTLAALRDLEDLLPEDRFIRVHRSFIVSLAGIRSWNTSSIEMNGGKQVPVGRVYKEGFLTAIGRLRDMRL